MKIYWFLFSDGFTMKCTIHAAKAYSKNECTFKCLSIATLDVIW